MRGLGRHEMLAQISQRDRNAAPVEPVRGFGMNRRQKLVRLAALVAVLSAFTLPCAGWGWDGDANGSPDEAPAAAHAG
jgi:hypothetical protein